MKGTVVGAVGLITGACSRGRTIAGWGLVAKPNADDVRETPSRVIIESRSRRDAAIQACDEVAMPKARRMLAGMPRLHFVDHQCAALEGADAPLIVTEWKEFCTPDFDHIKATLKQPLILDGRNPDKPALMQEFNIDHDGVCRISAPAPAAS